jgi:Nucleotidyl transferase AbiEii toxin, Type IV TA system
VEALKRINEAIRQSVARLKKQGFQTHAPASADVGETKLLVRQGTIEVKVEVNFVMRGTVDPVRTASLTQSARDTLQADLEVPVVSLEDVYGGKLVAAMDRKHPRDLAPVHLPSEIHFSVASHRSWPRCMRLSSVSRRCAASFPLPTSSVTTRQASPCGFRYQV